MLHENEPTIHPGARLTNSTLGRYVEIGADARLLNVEMGDYSYCDRLADIANARIGKFANIAALTRLGPTDHPMTTASLHHFLYRSASYWDGASDDDLFFAARAGRVLTVGHDTWFGHGAIVKPGLTIGTGAVIAAGAVVTRDVAPYAIVAGNPARVLRMRFAPEIIDRLIAMAWWNWGHDRLRDALPDFRALSAEAFLDRYGA